MQFRRLIRIALLSAVLLASPAFSASAQYYQIGSDPASTKWSKIKGEHFDVIYPRQMDSLARRYLYLFEKYRDVTNEGLRIEPEKVPLILHPYEVRSNATVVWAPKRVELYTTPPFNSMYAQNWDEQLAIHEGRHIGQMTHYTKGIYNVLGTIAGEQAIAIGVGFYPAKTLLEGDAVSNETDFSKAGRGRSGDFLMYYKAAFDAGDYRTHPKWRFGSYRNYTPNNYVMGYFLNSFMRYNANNYYVTGDIMSHQVKWWWRIFSVSHKSYQYASGLTSRKNFRYAVPMMDAMWKVEAMQRKPYNDFDTLLVNREKYYTEFTDVIPVGDGVLASKSGMQYSRHLVRIDSEGNQHYVTPLAATTSRLVPDGDGSLLFSEVVPDPRWELRSYSILRSYDIADNKFHDITSKTRLFNPALSADGNILAVEYRIEGGSDVVKLDRDGGVLEKVAAPQGFQLTELAELDGDIYSVAVTTGGMGVYKYDGSEWSCVVKDQSREIRDFQSGDDGLLYFVSDLDGASNIYSLDPDDGKLTRVVSAHFGTTKPTIRDSVVYYSDFDHLGYKPAVTDLREAPAKSASFSNPFKYKIADSNSQQAAENVTFLTEEEDAALRSRIESLESKPYSKLGHTVHIHSWAPFYANVERIMDFSYEQFYQLASPGLTLVSQNNLGTAVTTFGYGFHKGNWGELETLFDKSRKYDNFHSLHLNFNYSGLYPVFEFAADYNDRHKVVTALNGSEIFLADTTSKASLDLKANVYVPINLSKGGWNSGLVPQLEYTFSNDQYAQVKDIRSLLPIEDVHGLPTHYNQSLLYSIRYYRMLAVPKSKRVPKWGFGVVASGKSAVGAVGNSGNLAYLNLYGYTPGIGKDQGVKLALTWQKQFQGDGYSYVPNIASMPRGYKSPILRDYTKLSIDYSCPIYFLESSYCFLGYLMRFNAAPFFDIAHNRTPGAENPWPYSYGTLFTMKFHPFRFGMTLEVGIRYARTAEGNNSIKFVMSSSL